MVKFVYMQLTMTITPHVKYASDEYAVRTRNSKLPDVSNSDGEEVQNKPTKCYVPLKRHTFHQLPLVHPHFTEILDILQN